MTIKMNLLLFCIAIITITSVSLEAARIKRDENLEFEVCPESHPYAFDYGEV
jgi:hypothetical protein